MESSNFAYATNAERTAFVCAPCQIDGAKKQMLFLRRLYDLAVHVVTDKLFIICRTVSSYLSYCSYDLVYRDPSDFI